MNRSVTCYFAKGGNGKRVAPAFALGCGGRAQRAGQYWYGPSAIYGVKESTYLIWRNIKSARQPWWYIDNAYFGRGEYFRITRDAIQPDGTGEPDWDRWRSFNIPVRGWRNKGDHILVCEQSDDFMRLTCGIDRDQWRAKVKRVLSEHTDRPIIWRKKDDPSPIRDFMRRCHAVVTHTSNSAVDAVLAGVPVFLTGPSAARAVGCTDLTKIETPLTPDGVERWAAVLAGQQWTLDEMRSGQAWSALNGHG